MEYWDAYDRNGNRTGETLVRGQPVPEGRYHMAGCVVVRHADGDFLLLLRSPEKKTWPNVWEIGAGGCALRSETAEQCAHRELWEDTGIWGGDWHYTGRHWGRDIFYEGFLCITDMEKDRIVLQPGETADYRWVSLPEFLEFYDSDRCVEPIKRRLAGFVEELRAGE